MDRGRPLLERGELCRPRALGRERHLHPARERDRRRQVAPLREPARLREQERRDVGEPGRDHLGVHDREIVAASRGRVLIDGARGVAQLRRDLRPPLVDEHQHRPQRLATEREQRAELDARVLRGHGPEPRGRRIDELPEVERAVLAQLRVARGRRPQHRVVVREREIELAVRRGAVALARGLRLRLPARRRGLDAAEQAARCPHREGRGDHSRAPEPHPASVRRRRRRQRAGPAATRPGHTGTGTMMQLAQPSPLRLLPSSHPSPASWVPLPHVAST